MNLMSIARWILGIVLAWSSVLASRADDVAQAGNRVPIVVDSQPLDRWIHLIAVGLRDAGASAEADAIALQARAVAALIKLDASRPISVRGELLDQDNGEPELDKQSIIGLLPVQGLRDEFDQTRIEFPKSGVRKSLNRDSELGETEYFATTADEWALLAKTEDRVRAEALETARSDLGNGPSELVRMVINGGVISRVRKEEMIAELWRDVERDLIRGDDEPPDVFALRSELQTAFGQSLERIIAELDAISVAIDVAEGDRIESFDTRAELQLAWRQGESVDRMISQLQPVESRFRNLASTPSVARVQFHFRIPSRLTRRFARWFDTGCAVAVSLAEQTKKREWIPFVQDLKEGLGPAVSDGRVDGLLDIVRVDDRMAFQMGIDLPGEAIKDLVERILNDQQIPMPPRRQVAGRDFYQLGEPGRETDSPFGPHPEAWVSVDEHAVWMSFGQSEAVQAFGERIRRAQRMVSSSASESDESFPTLTGRELVRMSVNNSELNAALQPFATEPGIQSIVQLLSKLPRRGADLQATARQDNGTVVLSAYVAGPTIGALAKTFVEMKKKTTD